MRTPLNIGADIAKDEITVACSENSFAPRSLGNRSSELIAWLKLLPTGTRIALESTGSYHELLANLAHARGLSVLSSILETSVTMPRPLASVPRPTASTRS